MKKTFYYALALLLGGFLGLGTFSLKQSPSDQNSDHGASSPTAHTDAHEQQPVSKVHSSNKESVLNEVKDLVQTIIKLSPEEIQQEILLCLQSLQNDKEPNLKLELLINRLGETAPLQGLEFSKKLGKNKALVSDKIFSSWGGKDPHNALELIKNLPRDEYARALRLICIQWAETHPEEAYKWYYDFAKDSNTIWGYTFRDIMEVIAKKNIPLALNIRDKYPKTLPFGIDERNEAIAKEWAKQDWPSAKTWLDQFDQVDKSSLYKVALASLAQSDPHLAISELSSQLPSESFSEFERNYVEAAITQSLLQIDVKEATEWLSSTPSGKNKDQMIRRLLDDVFYQHLEEAAPLYAQISEKSRDWELNMEAIMKEWNKQDSAKAKEWLEKSSLSPEIKQKISSNLK